MELIFTDPNCDTILESVEQGKLSGSDYLCENKLKLYCSTENSHFFFFLVWNRGVPISSWPILQLA